MLRFHLLPQLVRYTFSEVAESPPSKNVGEGHLGTGRPNAGRPLLLKINLLEQVKSKGPNVLRRSIDSKKLSMAALIVENMLGRSTRNRSETLRSAVSPSAPIESHPRDTYMIVMIYSKE